MMSIKRVGMKLDFKKIAQWPRLAWLAECSTNDENIRVYHGDWVEVREHWFCEGVWAGDFLAGDFDNTDIVAGSGGRIRNNKLCFVSSGSNVDRLHSLRKDDVTIVSNSLICLLAWVDGQPDLDYSSYKADFARYRHTVFGNHTLIFPSSAGPVELTYFANLLWDGKQLIECEKPSPMRDFGSFNDYRNFLQDTMRLVATNATHGARLHRFKLLCALSNGYDSPTIAALAREACDVEAFTFKKDREGRDDSGEAIAAILGIPCHAVDRDAWRSESLVEIPFIACSGSVSELAFKSAESVLRGSVLLSGPSGDTVWDKKTPISSEMVIGAGSMLGFTEYRLWTGFINCAVSVWGVKQIHDIIRLSRSTEMAPWDTGGNYSRPICRRIVEEAGVPRSLFGVEKKGVAVVPRTRHDYLSRSSLEDLFAWLGEQHEQSRGSRSSLPHPTYARLLDRIVTPLADALASTGNYLRHRRGFRRLRPSIKTLEKRLKRPYYHHHYLVHWAIDRAKKRYQVEGQR